MLYYKICSQLFSLPTVYIYLKSEFLQLSMTPGALKGQSTACLTHIALPKSRKEPAQQQLIITTVPVTLTFFF